MPSADPDKGGREIEEIIGIDAQEAIEVSAKTGLRVDDLLEQIIKKVPPPSGNYSASPRALILDSWFDKYLEGCVTHPSLRREKLIREIA